MSVTTLKREKDIIPFTENSKRTIVFYGAKYCPACIEMKPLYERIASRYSNRVSFSYVDIEDARIKLDVVPILEGYYNGKGIHKMEGIDTVSLKQFIKMIINYRS